MMIEIKHRYTGAVLFTSQTAETVKRALLEAISAGADLAGADLARANLAGADLARAYLADANLARAYLADANLAGADRAPEGTEIVDPPEPYMREAPTPEVLVRRAEKFRVRNPHVPVIENLDQKILAVVTSGAGELDMSQWHTCETTHCRAGWAIHLAGGAGRDLEAKHGPFLAGGMIYRASTGRAPHFFASTQHALEDIRACAGTESGQ
jgi:hypothetical protein